MRLKDKLAVITAAASGMGRAGVELFAREGATVAAIDINAQALKTVADDANAKGGGKVVPIVSDLSTIDGVRRSIAEAASALGGIDVMWAHAGTPGPAAVEGLDPAEYEKAMALNVTSAVFGAAEVVGHMRQRGGGSLVFTASVSGLVGSMFSPVYSAGKFAVVGLTKSLAQRFAADRVRVNVVCPGPIDTPMLPGFIGRSDDKQQMAENQKKLMAAVPLGRIGRPEEVAHAVLWLASDDASYVTGIALPVDGGYLAR
jgi:NAD(P)-dependent dehydrogenase (short-subunit alcohol dehydrogenase family)